MNYGSKPSKGTPADRRLKVNKTSTPVKRVAPVKRTPKK